MPVVRFHADLKVGATIPLRLGRGDPREFSHLRDPAADNDTGECVPRAGEKT